ncbi:ATPase [Pontibaca methylaminivorans]|uniref:AAA+ ATPase domain-containing protein n=1 Tax=Pontibaca methylaminivorans TaxID=515897 RepID=A0A1R3WQV4_9RHOB|nr:ATPase [Pontibaca methylaminivorans]SIT78993.1 hypothetical protein SAMN05421849_1052 [Pontibaca methylaminivorans]
MNLPLGPSLAPSPPRKLAEMRLSTVLMRDIVLKTMFRKNIESVAILARAICLPLPITQELLDIARGQKLIEAIGHRGGETTREMGYRLTESGRARAHDALAQSAYFGAMPVPLGQYCDQVKRQSIRRLQMSRSRLEQAMAHLVLPPGLLDQLGPAVGAGRSVLLYGPPGNGKSSISNAIRDALGDHIHVPRAIEHAGQVIPIHDPIVHDQVPEAPDDPLALRLSRHRDSRYLLCKRPCVITGGELTLSMLDLTYDPIARTYQAPLQLKSTGGIFIVDDLGRQADSPQALINRWIVPLEEGRDILTFQSGEKFEVPFDTLVIFSTNQHPGAIFDQAALRRIFFKIRIDGPGRADFLRIFSQIARQKGLPLDEVSLLHLLKVKYPMIGNVYASYQPGFLIDQVISICDFEGIPRQMSPELLDRAWSNMFVQGNDAPP